jgi:hypothetical protein
MGGRNSTLLERSGPDQPSLGSPLLVSEAHIIDVDDPEVPNTALQSHSIRRMRSGALRLTFRPSALTATPEASLLEEEVQHVDVEVAKGALEEALADAVAGNVVAAVEGAVQVALEDARFGFDFKANVYTVSCEQ